MSGGEVMDASAVLHKETVTKLASTDVAELVGTTAAIGLFVSNVPDETQFPQLLQLVDPLVALVSHENSTVKQNSVNALGALISQFGEPCIDKVAATGVAEALLAAAGAAEAGVRMNSCVALAALAGPGGSGLAQVLRASPAKPLAKLLADETDEKVAEVMLDVVCSIASNAEGRPAMCDGGVLPKVLAQTLAAAGSLEVRVRALLALCVLGASPLTQQALAENAAAVRALTHLMRQGDDDEKEMARTLFGGLMKNADVKPLMEAAIRGASA